MSTATTNTVIDHTGDAGYRAWIAEIIAQLLAVGLTQTADTGQVNTGTVTRPAINTLNAYAVFRFNDTAHGTNPIFLKFDFGTGGTANFPQMRITVGRGSNGSGTINGLTMTRVACCISQAPASIVTPYVSRFVYSATQGFLAMCWKLGGAGASAFLGGFVIYRSNDANGDPTTDSTHLLSTNGSDTAATAGGSPPIQVISHLTSTVYNTSPFPSNNWSTKGMPLDLTLTLYSSDAQVMPVWQYTPKLGINNNIAIALVSEFPLNSTVAITIMGSTSHTYISVGNTFLGTNTIGGGFTGTHTGLILWE